MYNFKNTTVRFKTNKPYLLKKVFMTTLTLGALTLFFAKLPFITAMIFFLLIIVPIVVKISKQQSEGRGIIGKFINYYKNLYKEHKIDKTPITVNVTEDEIKVDLIRCELIKNKPVSACYSIQKKEIAGMLYDDVDNDIVIMFTSADIDIHFSDDGSRVNKKNVKYYDTSIAFNINEHLSLIDDLKSYEYPIEYLSEIDDSDVETEDPELAETQENKIHKENVDTADITDTTETEEGINDENDDAVSAKNNMICD